VFTCEQSCLCLHNIRTSQSFFSNWELSGFTSLQLMMLWDTKSSRRFNLPVTLSILFKILQFYKNNSLKFDLGFFFDFIGRPHNDVI
jgi:hypothetical protein